MDKWSTSTVKLRERLEHALFGTKSARHEIARDVEKTRAQPRIAPIMILAFEGWSDAGEAASSAAAFLVRALGAHELCEIGSEKFYNYTEARPFVSLAEGRRSLVWPATHFYLAKGSEEVADLILVTGPEPQHFWKTYADQVVSVVRELGIGSAVSLGAYLGEVTHYRPVPVTTSSNDPEITRRHGIGPSLYEGPTGILGVLDTALADAGVPSIAIWANVSCYSIPVSPKATLALLSALSRVTGRLIDLSPIEEDAKDYEERMDEIVAEDEHIAAYVARIEEMEEHPLSDVSGEGLAQEIERYLRGNRSG